MAEIGYSYELEVIKILKFGAYLDAGELGEVLLPRRYISPYLRVGDSVPVFLYLDSEDRPVATTQEPLAKVGEFAYLKVIDTNRVGAFLDWGLDKDLLVPFAQQHIPLQAGHSYLVYVYVDKTDGRIVASAKIDQFIDEQQTHDFSLAQPVNLIIANSTELGFKAIINHCCWGVLYKDEVFQRLSFGQHINGFIKQIRADGKIDLTLQGGQQSRDQDSERILDYLKHKNGFAPVHDKSSPKVIADIFGISKGAFKKAIGRLYRQRLITIEQDGIHLTIAD